MNIKNDGKSTMNSMIFYTIANIISIIVSLIAIPILTNLLVPADMGIAVSFNTLKTILSYVFLLSVYITIDRAILDLKEKINEYLSSIFIVSTISLTAFFVIYLIFQNQINHYLSITTPLMLLMFLIIFLTNGFTLLGTYWNFKNYYVRNFIISLLSVPVAQIVSILLVMFLNNNKYLGRIIGVDIFSIIFGIIFGIIILVKGKFKFKKEYIKYALKICIPILPHLVSQLLLAQSSLLIIKYFSGASSTGIYSTAFTISMVLYTFLFQILKPWSPWVYRRLDENNTKSIYEYSEYLIIIGFICTMGISTISSEAINLFLNNNYSQAAYIVQPLFLGVFFQFISIFFYDVQYYHKKSKRITIISLLSAGLNIILSYLFVTKFGFMYVGYATAISYFFLAVMHYINYKKINNSNIYNIKIMISYSMFAVTIIALNILFVNNWIIRYLIFIISITIVLALSYKKWKEIIPNFFVFGKQNKEK